MLHSVVRMPICERVGPFYLWLGIFAYSWSVLLAVIWFGLFYLRLKFGLVFLLKVENWLGLFLLTVAPSPEIGFGLTVPPSVAICAKAF